MNIDFRKILIIILGSLWLWLMISILYGCSANYHFGKFLKKGGTIDTTERVVSVEKVIKVNGKDSIILVEMPLNCPEVQIPAWYFIGGSAFHAAVEQFLKEQYETD